MPTLGNVLMLLMMFWLVFGILGVQLFKGKFYFCNDDLVVYSGSCTGSFMSTSSNKYVDAGVVELGLQERKWSRGQWGFDNIGEAIVTLFEVSTLEMWLDIMYLCLGAHAAQGFVTITSCWLYIETAHR